MAREADLDGAPSSLDDLRERLASLLGWAGPPGPPVVAELSSRSRDGYVEQLVEYANVEGHTVKAFLLRPDAQGAVPGVVVFHQHNREWHLGKSEVAGLAGDPLQAFGPRLAKRGVVVLAPDAVCFEDRRHGGGGTDPAHDDFQQHYNEMAYRLISGSPLMKLVMAEAAQAISLLAATEGVSPDLIGTLGHSMGGHTALFAAALDKRIRFVCASGAASGYRARVADGVGIEFAQVIPSIITLTDLDGLVSLIAPRPLLLVSADEDPYSRDAQATVAKAARAYEELGAPGLLEHLRYQGGHALTPERAEAIIGWLTSTCAQLASEEDIAT